MLFLFLHISLWANPQLLITSSDVRVEEHESGFLLIIRKRPAVQSILVTESTRRADAAGPVYTYWTAQYNSMNGNEKRILNGEVIDDRTRYYLTDSSPEADSAFGSAFKIFVPRVVQYGFPWTRQGFVEVSNGTFINIRTFSLPFADYAGAYSDNPFLIRIDELQSPVSTTPALPNVAVARAAREFALPLTATSPRASQIIDASEFVPNTIESLASIAEETGGTTRVVDNGSEVVNFTEELLRASDSSEIDLVIALDTTRSMRGDIVQIQKELPELIMRIAAETPRLRLGLVQYRDYNDAYVTTVARSFTEDEEYPLFVDDLQRVTADGGEDQPEAVYEALYSALESFQWRSPTRYILLIADAPPHPTPRGTVQSEDVFALAARRGIRIHTLALPQ